MQITGLLLAINQPKDILEAAETDKTFRIQLICHIIEDKARNLILNQLKPFSFNLVYSKTFFSINCIVESELIY